MRHDAHTPPPATPTRRPRRRWWRDLLWIACILMAVRWYQQRGLVASEMLPDALQGTTLTGERLTAESMRGEPVLVYFWATWCGVCDAMAGNVNEVAKHHRVLSVASRSGSPAQVRARAPDLAYETLVDADGFIAQAFGVRAFPTSFFVDADGRIRSAEVGYTTELGMRLRLLWRSLF